jgi:hypothetical protein
MKKYIFFLAVASIFTSCKNNEGSKSTEGRGLAEAYRAATDTTNFTTIQWMDTVKNIGVLSFGDKANIEFRFKNSGDKPLLIVSAQPGCGCTVADYPKEPVSPGAEGVITAGFDTNKGSVGQFSKTIMVTTNTKGATNTNLVFKGEIKKGGA